MVGYMQKQETGSRRASRSGGNKGRPRNYRSELREERAAETKSRIVTAARGLFASRGFAGTTVAVIAQEAGVAVPTVYAVFGNKSEIMRELLSRLEIEADAERWRERVDDERDPHAKLERYAAWHRELFSTGSDVLGAALNASGDPAVVELRAQGDRNARSWLDPITADLADAGALLPGLTREHAADRAWMLTCPEFYFRATAGCGWTDDEYQRWLTDLLQNQLLRPKEGHAAGS
jgi:AcrR family transcriptional regulator